MACIDNADEVRFALAAAASGPRCQVDAPLLSSISPNTAASMPRSQPQFPASSHMPPVLRPRGIPALAGGAADLRAVGHQDGSPPSLERDDVTLVLGDLDPSVGADYLRVWTDRVIVVVTAGRSSAERVRTAADLVRIAGLEMRVAALLRTERTDDSSGVTGFDQPVAVQLREVYEQQLLPFESPVDGGQRLASS